MKAQAKPHTGEVEILSSRRALTRSSQARCGDRDWALSTPGFVGDSGRSKKNTLALRAFRMTLP